MGEKEMTLLMGGAAGLVLGFIEGKIDQIWAILYESRGLALEGVSNWEGKPLWKTVNENPGTSLFIVMLAFLIIGLGFAYLFTQTGRQD